MSERIEAVREVVADAMIEYGPDGHIDGYEEITAAALAAGDAPIHALISEAESRHGSLYCKVTTYELRKALGMDVTNWPEVGDDRG